jgi:hypothetical protein
MFTRFVYKFLLYQLRNDTTRISRGGFHTGPLQMGAPYKCSYLIGWLDTGWLRHPDMGPYYLYSRAHKILKANYVLISQLRTHIFSQKIPKVLGVWGCIRDMRPWTNGSPPWIACWYVIELKRLLGIVHLRWTHVQGAWDPPSGWCKGVLKIEDSESRVRLECPFWWIDQLLARIREGQLKTSKLDDLRLFEKDTI